MATGVVMLDPWLGPFKDALRARFSKTQSWIKTIQESEGGLDNFSRVSMSNHSLQQLTLIRDTRGLDSTSYPTTM
jgi:hypothetical protein